MRVRAKSLGFYGNTRRRPGEIFDVSLETHFTSSWMERLEETKDVSLKPEVKTKGKNGKEARPSADSNVKPSGDTEVI